MAPVRHTFHKSMGVFDGKAREVVVSQPKYAEDPLAIVQFIFVKECYHTALLRLRRCAVALFDEDPVQYREGILGVFRL
jgi:hypothetical protein